jgi:aspartate kinase
MNDILVMKFGGASLADINNFKIVADIIYKRSKHYKNLVVVVSAMADATDNLLKLAKQVHPSPPKREQDMLISVGERISMSLLAMALSKNGMEAISFTGSQSGIITCCKHSNASIIDVKPKRIISNLQCGKIVIVAGFQGVSQKGEITTLGRGGSDTSAVALAISLGATKVEFYKDVDGIYSKDPKKHQDVQVYKKMHYNQLLKILEKGSQVLHQRCVNLASKNKMQLHLLPFNKGIEKKIEKQGTMIGEKTARCLEPIFEDGY